MGLVYAGSCNNCGYKKDYKLNENVKIFKEKINDREKLIKRLDDVNKDRVDQLISDNEHLKKYIFKNVENGFHIEFSYKVHKCNDCSYFVDKPHMELRYNGKKIFETSYKCKNCGQDLIIDENAFMELEKYNSCPECRTEAYTIKPKDVWE